MPACMLASAPETDLFLTESRSIGIWVNADASHSTSAARWGYLWVTWDAPNSQHIHILCRWAVTWIVNVVSTACQGRSFWDKPLRRA